MQDLTPAIAKPYTIHPLSPTLIPATVQPHSQHILWIGCSDSLVSETDSLDISRDEIFVHRNLGNIISNGDLSSQSAIEWAVELLKVDHIVICGHYGCALTRPEHMDASELHGWHRDVTNLHTATSRSLSHPSSPTLTPIAKEHRLEEVYVLAEVDWLKKQPNVRTAMNERGMKVHALVFDKDQNRCMQLIETEGALNGVNATNGTNESNDTNEMSAVHAANDINS